MDDRRLSFYEFFAGAGMARAGLGSGWQCLFANDFDPKKGRVYSSNWGVGELRVGDVRHLAPRDLPGAADLVWGSFPCQDLSLAGGGAGLRGDRSGTFWPFWALMDGLIMEGRQPPVIILENVIGTLTSHGGEDFGAICGALQRSDYRVGTLAVDAALFVPQSRPRLFFVAAHKGVAIAPGLLSASPQSPWHSRGVQAAYARLPAAVQKDWLWWRLPLPPTRTVTFADIVENDPRSVAWHTPAETSQLLTMMSELHRAKLDAARRSGRRMVGGVYKRTRLDRDGRKVQRAEIRFDDVAGCLRTPAGGSSRQTIIVVQGEETRSRLISTRETARLMGLPDSYDLPRNYNEAYHLTGDGVVVPVVRHLAKHIFEPLLRPTASERQAA